MIGGRTGMPGRAVVLAGVDGVPAERAAAAGDWTSAVGVGAAAGDCASIAAGEGAVTDPGDCPGPALGDPTPPNDAACFARAC